MQMSTLLATAALAITASASGGTPTTAVVPGLTMTLPVGIDSSTTKVIEPQTVTGDGAVISGVTAIVAGPSVYLVGSDGGFAYGNAQGTNAFNDVTIIDGSLPGGSGTAQTTSGGMSGSSGSSGSMTATPTPTTVTTTNSQGSTVVSTGQTTPTTKPNAGERAYGSANMAAMGGVVAIAGAVMAL